MSTAISLRESTCTLEIVQWLRSCEGEDADCLAKVAAFAIRFFGTILCFLSLVGIPLYVLFSNEEARQELEAEFRNEGAFANPQETAGLARQISDLTAQVSQLQEENVRLKACAPEATGHVEALAELRKDVEVARILAKQPDDQYEREQSLRHALIYVTNEFEATLVKTSKLYLALEQVKVELPSDKLATVPLFSPVRTATVARTPQIP
jgi:hypothetical protein